MNEIATLSWLDAWATLAVVAAAIYLLWRKLRAPSCVSCPSAAATPAPSNTTPQVKNGSRVALSKLSLATRRR